MGKSTQPDLPAAFGPKGETNQWLAQFKSARVGKWSLKSSKSLREMADLGFFLTALGRFDEALEVLGYPSDRVAFAGDYNIWTWVRVCISLRYRLLLECGRHEEAIDSIQRLRGYPYAIEPRPEVLNSLFAERRLGMQQVQDRTVQARGRVRVTLLSILYSCTQISMCRAGILNMEEQLLQDFETLYKSALEALREMLEEDDKR